MTPADVQSLFLEQLGVSLGDEMIDYLVRRFQEGGAAAAPTSFAEEITPAKVRRFAELACVLGFGAAVPAETSDPLIQ